jgi:hypothetical protein
MLLEAARVLVKAVRVLVKAMRELVLSPEKSGFEPLECLRIR